MLTAMLAVAAAGSARNAPQKIKEHASTAPRDKVRADEDGTAGATTLQIVAHPDDDLYFMNPDVRQSIDANHRVVSIYLTSGEADGRNNVPGSKNEPTQDYNGYAGSRQQGLRQAYALMATGDPLAEWDRYALSLPGGIEAETDSLAAHPGVTLVFLSVSQHTRNQPDGDVRLQNLWADPKATSRTHVATGSTVRHSRPVTRGGLINALAGLLEQYRPTLVRTMDPDPDKQVHDAKHRQHHDQEGYSDHPDHTAAALFTYAALQHYHGPGRGRHFTVTAYRGYYNERWPHNLPPVLVRSKADVLNAYGGSPDLGCGFVAGCGDYDVGKDRSYRTGWLQSTVYRYPGTSTWLQLGPDKRLTAFTVLDQQAAMWTETAPGSGRFNDAELLGGGQLVPHLAVSLTKDGRWQLFAEHITGLTPDDARNRREIIALEQQRPGGPFGEWINLGNPESDPVRSRRVGAPVITRNANGSAQVFVRTWAKSVATTRQAEDGSWSEWTHLGDVEVQEGLSAVTAADGRIHLVGSGHATIYHWTQERSNGPLTPAQATGLPASADPPTLTALPDGSVLLTCREPKLAKPLTHRLTQWNAQWTPQRLGLAGRGYGMMAAAHDPSADDAMIIVGRNNAGTLSTAVLGLPHVRPNWATLDAPLVGAPSVAANAQGHLTIATVNHDGTLRTTIQEAPGRWRSK